MARMHEQVAPGFVGRPRHRLFMVLDDRGAVDGAMEWLRLEGGGEGDVWFLHGEEGSRALDPTGRLEGLHGRLIAGIRRAMSDDVGYLLVLQQAVDAGKTVVAVPLVNAAVADKLARGLRAMGARDMAYFGNWVFQPVGARLAA